ncbi:MAG: hypothetical protein GY854_32120 [Deltaproteobacteria bacterium]|nr:hypothetical protein [Deltaproteobacteria bacterium]
MERISLSICLLAAHCFIPTTAQAQDGRVDKKKEIVVVLVGMEKCCPDRAWTEAEKTVLDEIAALGLRAVIEDGEAVSAKEQQQELETVANEKKAACSLRIFRSPKAVHIWMIDQKTGDTTFRKLSLAGEADSEAASIATLRTVEAIRAGLLGQRLQDDSGPEPISEPEPRPSEEASEKPEQKPTPNTDSKGPPMFGVGIGVGILGGPGDVGPLGAAHLTLGFSPVSFLAAEIDGALSFVGGDIEDGNARSSFNVALVRGWLFWEILNSSRVRPSLGLGGGALFSWSEGIRDGGFKNVSDHTTSAYLGGAGRVGFVVARHFWIRLDGRVGFLVPEVSICFENDDNEVASFGRPIFEGFLNLEVRFP